MTTDSASGGNIWTPRKKTSVAITEFKFENKMWVIIAAITVTIASVLTILLLRSSYFSSPVLVTTDTILTATIEKDSFADQAYIIGAVLMLVLTAIALALAFNPRQINFSIVMGGTMALFLTILGVFMVDPMPAKMKNSIDVQAWFSDTLNASAMPELSFADGEQTVFLNKDSQIVKITTQVDGNQITLTANLAETTTEK